MQPNGNYAQNYIWEWNITKVTGNNWYTGLVWVTNVTDGTNQRGPGDGSGRPTFVISSDYSTIAEVAGAGCNLEEGFSATTGASLWNATLPYEPATGKLLYNTNDFLELDPTFNTVYCYSDITGALLWSTPNIGIYPYNTKGLIRCSNDLNNIYMADPDGTMCSISIATGKINWITTPIPTTEAASNVLGLWETPVLVGGLIYEYAGYSLSYEINPISRFSETLCFNATTGALVWSSNNAIYINGAADGYVYGIGILNGISYVLGMGQTSTAVSVSSGVIAQGSTVQISGNVLDQSPAQPGTPAVSDSSMSEQMNYLHGQNATLLNSGYTPQGVQVTLTAVDPNNNTIIIGTTTTDSAGNYYYNYVPPHIGIYKITATFAGTNSYWPSTAETGVTVTAAAATTTTQVTTTTSGVSTTTLYTAVIAIIIVLIVVAIALALFLRKRP